MSKSKKKKKSTENWFLLACSLIYRYPLSFVVTFIPNTLSKMWLNGCSALMHASEWEI
jgi:hypothetical protein